MDQWHGILLGCISTLCTVVVAMWRHILQMGRKTEKLHADHKDDIRELTQAALELGMSVSARALPPGGSVSLPPPSGESDRAD